MLAPVIAKQEAAIVAQFGDGRSLEIVVAAIRAGKLDADIRLHRELYHLAVLRLRATKPETLPPEDRE
jgi:hypothetical protein